MNDRLRQFDGLKYGNVAVIGDLLLDHYVTGSVERISPEAPVPVLHYQHSFHRPGGAANVACSARALGARVRVAGFVGEDENAAILETLLKENGVASSKLVRRNSWPTIAKTRVVSGRQQIARIDRETLTPPSAEEAAALIRAGREIIRGADAVVFSDYAKGCLEAEILADLIACARAQGCIVLADPKKPSFDLYKGAHLLTPNLVELKRVSGAQDLGEAALEAALQKAGASFGGDILLTRAADGMSLWRQGRAGLLNARAEISEVADVSGAGDTVVAVMAVMASAGLDFAQSMPFALRAASLAVRHFGTAQISGGELRQALVAEAALEGSGQARICGSSEKGWQQTLKLAQGWRENGERLVFANGCFDVLHPGHLHLLEQARAQGDRLIVGLNSDSSVQKLKGPSRPLQNEAVRARILAALEMVDLVVLFEEETPLALIRLLSPDVLVKGSDYAPDQVVGAQWVRERGGRVHLASLKDGFSTTAFLARITGPGEKR